MLKGDAGDVDGGKPFTSRKRIHVVIGICEILKED